MTSKTSQSKTFSNSVSIDNEVDLRKAIAKRLEAAKKAIDVASQEAHKYASFEQPVLGESHANSPSSTSSSTDPSDRKEENMLDPMEEKKRKDKASLELGLFLFGDSVERMEHELNSRLSHVESDLQDVLHFLRNFNDGTRPNKNSNSSSNANKESRLKEKELENDVVQLRLQLEFLKLCSEIRLALDQVSTFAFGGEYAAVSARSLTAKTIDGDLGSEWKEDSNILVFSSTASLPTRTSSSSHVIGQNKQGDNLVQRAKILAHANGILIQVEDRFIADIGGPQNTPFTGPYRETAKQIFDSLAEQLRRKRVDLQFKIFHVIDTGMVLETNRFSVRDGNGLLADAWMAATLLSSTTTVRKDHVLPHGPRKLEEILRPLSNNLYHTILEPLLSSCGGGESSGNQKSSSKRSPMLRSTFTWQVSESVSNDTIGSFIRDNDFGTSNDTFTIPIKGPTKVLEWTVTTIPFSSNASHVEKAYSVIQSFSSLLQVLQSIFTFVHEKALCKKKDLTLILGQLLFGSPSNSMTKTTAENNMEELLQDLRSELNDLASGDIQILKSLSTLIWDYCIPDTADERVLSTLPQLAEKLRVCTSEFESALIDQGFRVDINILSDYAIHFEENYTEKKRALFLNQGRTLLLTTDYHNTIHVGTDVSAKQREKRKQYELELNTSTFTCDDDGLTVFVLHKSAISQTAHNLMEMVRQTMECAVDPIYKDKPVLCTRFPPAMYRTARELLDLFRTVISFTHRVEIASIPRTAAVFFNDCVYFAHHCLTLGLEYRDRFSAIDIRSDNSTSNDEGIAYYLKQICTFVDMVPTFRELANQCMGDMIAIHTRQLNEIVGTRLTILPEALSSNESVVEWIDAETAQNAGLYHVRQLQSAWKGILSYDVYARAMGSLVDTILVMFVDQVLKVTDISETACTFTGALFRDLMVGVVDLFLEPSMTLEEAKKDASIYCHHCDRFVAIGKLMDMTLADITLSLSEGVFKSLTATELSKLITAIFQDSDKRRKLLRQLATESKS